MNPRTEGPEGALPLSWGKVGAWAAFDFALTAFSMNMVSTYVALWVVKDQGAPDWVYASAKAVAMVLVIALAPLAGHWSDRMGRTKPLMAASLCLAVGAGGLMGLRPGLALGLTLFGLALVGYQLALVGHSAMLPQLGPVHAWGKISGLGRAVGYLGSLAAVVLGMAFATGKLGPWSLGAPGGSVAVFGPTALLVALAALPLLAWPEASRRTSEPTQGPGVWAEAKAAWHSPEGREALKFLAAATLFFDTVNTLRDFMGIYLVKVVGLSETGGSLQSFLLVLVLCSLVGALLWGWLTDRWGPKPALMAILVGLSFGFLGLALVPDPWVVKAILGPWLGLAFGGILVASRPMLATLIPAGREATYFGLFVLANDVGAIFGPLAWGATTAALAAHGTVAYRVAVGLQWGFLLVAIALLAKVQSPPKAIVPPGA
jgi:UMF1 family MFS transporter